MPGATSCAQCGAILSAAVAPASPAVENAIQQPWGPVVDRLREGLAGEFEIEGELGHGGMAAVFRARELALNRRVAIKVMAPGLILGEGMIERFRQEAITVANLQHANIVAVHSVRTLGDLHLFVMQYVPGRSLDCVLRDCGQLSVDATRAIVYHVGSALDYAHRRGVVHRDVKPGNVLLDADGDPVVTDFGIAKVAEAPGFTRVGMVIGTPAYMSPEQCLGYDVGPASDQYALGIVLYELLTGRPPFSGSSMALLRAHTEEMPAPIRSLRPDVPESIDAAVGRMLAKRPGDRFPDIAAAIEALEAHPLGAVGPLRAEMAALAGAEEAEARLADIVNAPRSPAPVGSPPSPPPSAGRGTRPAAPTVATIAIDASAEQLEVGDCVVLAATPRTTTGGRIDRVRLGWASSDDRVATVDAAGVVTARAPGSATITVSAGQIRATIDLVVVAPAVATIEVDGPTELRAGTKATLVARPLDRRGALLAVPVTWTSRQPALATIADDGTVFARRRGPAILVAEAGGVARAVSLTVTPAPVADVIVDRLPATLVVGATATARAVVRAVRGSDDGGDRIIEWRSGNPAIATVSPDGTVTARARGQVEITATCEGIRGAVAVTVVDVQAATVVITPPPSPLRLRDRVTLKATAYDADGRAISRPITWRTTDATVAPVDSSGRLVASAEGWAIITAECDGVLAHAEVVVRQQVVPVSAAGRRETRRLALRWWLLLAVFAGAVALAWRLLHR